MPIRSLASAFLLLAFATPALAAAAPQKDEAGQAPAPARAPSPARAAMLDKIVAFLVPEAPMVSMAIGGAETAYRTQLDRRRDLDRIEEGAPGLRDAMVAAAAAHARQAAPRLMQSMAQEARNYWDARLSDAELVAVSDYLDQPYFTRYLRLSVEMRPGDTVSQALARATAAAERAHPDTKEQAQRRQAFESSAVGRRLLPLINAYQRAMGQRQIRQSYAITREAVAAGDAAGAAHIARAAQIRDSI